MLIYVNNEVQEYVIKACVLTISDKGSIGLREDTSGPEVIRIIKTIGAQTMHYEIIPDDKSTIKNKLIHYSESSDLIITTGGTGLSPRDVTPEATLEVIEKRIDGIPEAMRASTLEKTARSMLSRAVAGVRGRTLIVNLPGSPKAVRENLIFILDVIPHAIAKIKGSEEDCAA